MTPSSGQIERHIAVLDPAVKTAELDCFNNIAKMSPLAMTYHLPALMGMDSVYLDENNIVGIMILGSGSSVFFDELPWQKPMNEWLMKKMLAGVPTIGFCYGHQLIGHLFGGKIDYLAADQHKELGFREVVIEKSTIWGAPRKGNLVVSHREILTTCPKEFDILAHSPLVAIDGIKHKKLPIYGFQPHPEATRGFCKNAGLVDDTYGPHNFTFGHELVKAFCEHVNRHF